jgi:hypothetical protein
VNLHNAKWRKSSRSSGGGSGDCVEVADLDTAVAVRDSKDPDGPVLAFGPTAWREFVQKTKHGEFDR